MLHTLVVYVENKPGVLSRVASLFRRRAFNIDSLTVGRTEKPDLSRMTIVVDADEDQARRIVANIYKLVNVLLVDDITAEPAIVRDLALIKVGAKHEARSHVLELASVFRARVVDVAPESLTIEITGAEDKIDGLLEVLRPYGLLEVVRTGQVAMRRGAKLSTTLAKASGALSLSNASTSSDVGGMPVRSSVARRNSVRRSAGPTGASPSFSKRDRMKRSISVFGQRLVLTVGAGAGCNG